MEGGGKWRFHPLQFPWPSLSPPGKQQDWNLPLSGQVHQDACCHFQGDSPLTPWLIQVDVSWPPTTVCGINNYRFRGGHGEKRENMLYVLLPKILKMSLGTPRWKPLNQKIFKYFIDRRTTIRKKDRKDQLYSRNTAWCKLLGCEKLLVSFKSDFGGEIMKTFWEKLQNNPKSFILLPPVKDGINAFMKQTVYMK